MGSASSINRSNSLLFEKYDEKICSGRVFMENYEYIGSLISKILDNKPSKVYFNGEFNIIAGSDEVSNQSITSNLPMFKYESHKKEVVTMSMLEDMEKKVWKKFRHNGFVVYDVIFYIDFNGYVNGDIKIIPNELFNLCFDCYRNKKLIFSSVSKFYIKSKFSINS